MKKENEISDIVKALIKDFMECKKLEDTKAEVIEPKSQEEERDIEAMFDRLNR